MTKEMNRLERAILLEGAILRSAYEFSGGPTRPVMAIALFKRLRVDWPNITWNDDILNAMARIVARDLLLAFRHRTQTRNVLDLMIISPDDLDSIYFRITGDGIDAITNALSRETRIEEAGMSPVASVAREAQSPDGQERELTDIEQVCVAWASRDGLLSENMGDFLTDWHNEGGGWYTKDQFKRALVKAGEKD